MKVLFAVSNDEISESIIERYSKEYKEIISYKNVYYFNAILKELQKDKNYDRIVISEELEAFPNAQYTQIDKFIFEKLDSISDEASNLKGDDIPIILICSDRREKSEEMLVKLFGIGVYNALIGNDRSVDNLCNLLNKPRLKKDAKLYYKIDSEDVLYQSESENDVSEMEIQNILAHYKRLGKDEKRYIDSFDNIASQYNDVQLRIISKFLPLNVRAVLEEKSLKYQQVISFNSKVSDNLRSANKSAKEKKNGTSEKLLTSQNSNEILSKPVVIPSSVNMSGTKKFAKNKKEVKPIEPIVKEKVRTDVRKVGPAFEEQLQGLIEEFDETTEITNKQSRITDGQAIETIVEEPKRRRGRPRKNPVAEAVNETEKPKRGRGRPRKNALPEEQEKTVLSMITTNQDDEDDENDDTILSELNSKRDSLLTGLKNVNEIEEDDYDDVMLPEFNEQEDEEDTMLPGFDEQEDEEDTMLPGFDEQEDEEDTMLPGFSEQEDEENTMLPGFDEQEDEEDNNLQGLSETPLNYTSDSQKLGTNRNESNILQRFEDGDVSSNLKNVNIFAKNDSSQFGSNYGVASNLNYNNNFGYQQQENKLQNVDKTYQDIDISGLLTSDKKVACFIGTSKNGTSFIVNNLAEITSRMGIDTAILDTTQNRNSYYIYTKNEEELRKTAMESINNLLQGVAKGIQVNKNLTIYTSLPEETEGIENAGMILQTLLKKHSLVLIDCDFETPLEYFEKAQEIYLVQTFDILTIQPLTAFLRELKSKNILRENKLKVVLNKAVKVRGVNDKTIIGGMAYYNDPAMSFMTELFDKNTIRYITIPFNEEVYTKYLENVINCEVSIKGYPKNMIQIFNELSNMVYPLLSGKAYYAPPKLEKNGFSPSMNSTLDQMKNKY